MKKNIQRQLIMFSKRLLYGFIIQLFFCTVLIANDSNAQRKTIENVKVNIAIKEKPVSVAFDLIESTTDFRFTYNDNLIDFNQTITIVENNKSVYKVLEEISIQTQMNFVQVNDNIHVKTARKKKIGVVIMNEEFILITGTVKDNLGEPLPGVTVTIEGTSLGTVTDIDGNYSLEVPEYGVLIFSFIGFERQRIVVGNNSNINVTLVEDASSLQEVVVMGYGVQTKKDLTGSVSTVNTESIDNRKAIQLSDALQGAMAGVTVSRTGSAPGQESTIRVRGITSLNVNDPLVIVDGVPGLSLQDINPNDVENITVLKDAASQAIYGARAAAGVILVTTKRGKEGRMQINLDSDFGFNSPTTLPKFTDAKTFRILSNERSLNDGGGIIFDPAINENYEQLNRDDPDRYPNTDWQDLIFNNNPSTRQRHDLSLSVGTERLFTRASVGYMKEDGLYDNIGFDRFTFRINNDIKFSKILTANADIGYRGSNSTNPAYDIAGGPVAEARRYPAWFSAIRQDGQWGEGKDGDNPLAGIVEGGINRNRRDVFNATLGVTLTPVEGLNIRANVSPVYEFGNFEIFRTPPIIPRLDGGFFPQNQLNLTLGNQKVFSLTNQLFASYQKSVNDHNFDFLIGYESFKTSWEQVESQARDLSVKLPALAFGDRSLASNQQFASENALESYFGRFSYDYKQKYYFQSNFRADGSSRFASDVRWGFFPSASVGWVISNENFDMPGFISFLKLRASYGEVGNERVGNARTGGSEFFNFYPYQGIFQPITNILFYNNNQISPALGLVQNFLSDNLIQWEKTSTSNIGLDFGFFEDKLTLAADYYVRRTEDIIDLLDIPNYLGFPQNTRTNVASMEASGLDLEIGYRGNAGKLNYSINGNAAFVNTEVTNLGGEFFLSGGGAFINRPGNAYNEWFGFKTDGLFQTQEEADIYGTGAKAGDIKILDLNDDGIINEQDRVALGPSLPRLNYGGSISLSYNNFDFNVVAYGVGKHTRRYEGFQVQPFDATFGNIPSNIVGKFWSPENTPEQNSEAIYPRLSLTSFRNYDNSDFWLYNGGFLRIQNVTLGYSLPLQVIERIKLNRVRAYVSLRDFFTIERNFLDGWDPEAGNASYPIMKSVIIGFQVQF
jgi:TonB-linked SusC/RagA family outer membrane protein